MWVRDIGKIRRGFSSCMHERNRSHWRDQWLFDMRIALGADGRTVLALADLDQVGFVTFMP